MPFLNRARTRARRRQVPRAPARLLGLRPEPPFPRAIRQRRRLVWRVRRKGRPTHGDDERGKPARGMADAAMGIQSPVLTWPSRRRGVTMSRFPRRRIDIDGKAMSRIVILAVLKLLIAGRGGGSGSSLQTVTMPTWLPAPAERVGAQRARAPGIVSRANSPIVATVHGEADKSELPILVLRSQCAGTQCTEFDSTIRPFLGHSDI